MLIFFVREETRGVSTGVVQGQPAMFRVAREDAVRQICEKLKQKLNEFYELESYDWLLVEPQGHASSFISDLIAFLQTTFQSFTNLPPEVAQVACKSACEHIATSMFQLLMNEEIKQMSMGALNQVNLDLLQCERECTVMGSTARCLYVCIFHCRVCGLGTCKGVAGRCVIVVLY
jgi:hypothetical protein